MWRRNTVRGVLLHSQVYGSKVYLCEDGGGDKCSPAVDYLLDGGG